MTYLCRLIAKDGEGATKLIEYMVENAGSPEAAHKLPLQLLNRPWSRQLFSEQMPIGQDYYRCWLFRGELTLIYEYNKTFWSVKRCAVDFDENAAKEA